MPCEYAGFPLKPFGFFDRNPASTWLPRLLRTGATVVPETTGMPEDASLAGSPACT